MNKAEKLVESLQNATNLETLNCVRQMRVMNLDEFLCGRLPISAVKSALY